MAKKKIKAGIFVVAAFIGLLIWWGMAEAKAEIQMGIGPSQVGSHLSGTMLTITERVQDRYDFTLGYITKQSFSLCGRPDCRWHVREQIFIGAEILIRSPWTDKLRLGIGPYYFQNKDRIGTTNFRIGLDIEYRFNDHLGLRARHFSNAGSGSDLTICREMWGCITNDWNTGQDGWANVTLYF